MAIGYTMMFAYIMSQLGKLNSVEQRALLALAGVGSVILGIATSYGLCALFGFFSSSMNQIVPFLLLGIGIDDMFVIVQNFEMLDVDVSHLPLEKRMGLCMKHAGIAITITTLTDLLAFFVGATTKLPALSNFCLYSATGILFVFLYMNTFFLGWFVLDQRRLEARRDALCCCIKKGDGWKPNSCSQRSYMSTVFRGYATFLLHPGTKLVVLVVTAGMASLSVWGTLQLDVDFDETIFVPKNSYLRTFYDNRDEYFPPSTGMSAAIYIAKVKNVYRDMDKLKSLRKDLGKMDSLENLNMDTVFDYGFERFVDLNLGEWRGYPEVPMKRPMFYETLNEFLFTKGIRHQQLLRFTEDEQLQCSKGPAPEIDLIITPFQHKV